MNASQAGSAIGQGSRTHGGTGTPEYTLWKEIRRKCTNPNRSNYAYYGGRGIDVCERWTGRFEDFLADVGHRPNPDYTLDRRDNEGGYWCGHCEECVRLGRPANCRWATRTEQAKNRRSTHLLTFNGKTQCLGDWAVEIGMTRDALRHRLQTGMSVEEALTRPRNNRGKQAR